MMGNVYVLPLTSVVLHVVVTGKIVTFEVLEQRLSLIQILIGTPCQLWCRFLDVFTPWRCN